MDISSDMMIFFLPVTICHWVHCSWWRDSRILALFIFLVRSAVVHLLLTFLDQHFLCSKLYYS